METYVIKKNGQLTIKKEHLEKLKQLKSEKEQIERELKTLSNAITNELKETYSETTKINDYNFVVKGGFYDLEFDLESFKQENIELYIKYLKPHSNEISFSLVSAIRERKEKE